MLPAKPAAERDLLTEASLPIEERGKQQRYTQIGTFNHYLSPTGQFTLPGPDVSRLPGSAAGAYLILLRIEATDDKEGDASLAAVGAGPGVIHSGAVAGFSLPALRYIVSGSGTGAGAETLTLLFPADNAVIAPGQLLHFTWAENNSASYSRLEVADMSGKLILAVMLRFGIGTYSAPAWLKDKAGGNLLRWRVLELDQSGRTLSETSWQSFRLLPGR